jgi:hypothetical protein
MGPRRHGRAVKLHNANSPKSRAFAVDQKRSYESLALLRNIERDLTRQKAADLIFEIRTSPAFQPDKAEFFLLHVETYMTDNPGLPVSEEAIVTLHRIRRACEMHSRGVVPDPSKRKRRYLSAKTEKTPRPVWMSDASVLPKRPPGQ